MFDKMLKRKQNLERKFSREFLNYLLNEAQCIYTLLECSRTCYIQKTLEKKIVTNQFIESVHQAKFVDNISHFHPVS